MTTLSVKSCVYVLTEIEGLTWRPIDYTTTKIKKTVKGEDIKGYFELKIGGKDRKFDNSNRDKFLPIMYNTLADFLSQEIQGNFSIVPIPNSSAIIKNRDDFRTYAMARAIAEKIGERASAVPALRWKTARDPAHKTGGFRDPQLHFANLVVVENLARPCVLFDDVLTSGSQMIGAYRRLKTVNILPVRGLTICKAVKEQMPKMIGWTDTELQVESDPFDLSDLF